MKTETIDLITKLKICATGLDTFFEEYKKKASEKPCDTHTAEFNINDRFTVFKKTVFFSAHKGYYGNSCCTFRNHIDDESEEAFLFVLNENKEKIFKEMATYLNKKAKGLTEEAKKELEDMKVLVASL